MNALHLVPLVVSASEHMAEQVEARPTQATGACYRSKVLGRVCLMSKLNVTVKRYDIVFLASSLL